MNRVEEGLDVDLALLSVCVGADLEESAWQLLAEECVIAEDVAIVKVKLGGDVLDSRVEEHVLAVKYDHRVDHILKVPDLVG